MGEGEREYIVNLCAEIGDEILVEAKNSYEAGTIAKEVFLESMTGKQAISLIKDALEATEVEEAL